MKELFYNPIECPDTIRYISKSRSIDVTIHPWDVPHDGNDYPLGYADMFSALKNEDFDDIIVSFTSHDGCYYPEYVGNGLCKRVPVIGDVSLLEFTNGGGSLKDKHKNIRG